MNFKRLGVVNDRRPHLLFWVGKNKILKFFFYRNEILQKKNLLKQCLVQICCTIINCKAKYLNLMLFNRLQVFLCLFYYAQLSFCISFVFWISQNSLLLYFLACKTMFYLSPYWFISNMDTGCPFWWHGIV